MPGIAARPAASPRLVIATVICMTALGAAGYSVLTPVLPDLGRALGVGNSALGVVQGAVSMPGIVLSPYVGYLTDRLGRRRIAVVSTVIFGLGGVAGFAARTFPLLVAARLLQGLGTTGLLSMGAVVIGDTLEAEQHARAISWNAAAVTVAGIAAPVVGGLLAAVDPFAPFLLYAAAFLLVPLTMRLPGRPGRATERTPFAHARDGLAELRERGHRIDYLGLVGFTIIVVGVFVGFGLVLTPLYLDTVFDVPVAQRGLLVTLMPMASTAAALTLPRRTRHASPARIMTAGLLALAAGLAIIGMAPGLLVLAAGELMTGWGLGSVYTTSQHFVSARSPAAYRGALVGIWVSALRLGQVVGPVAGAGSGGWFGERNAYLGASVLLVLVAVGWRPLRARLSRRYSGSSGHVPGSGQREDGK